MEKKTKIILGVIGGLAVVGTTIAIVKKRAKRRAEGLAEESVISDATDVVSSAVSSVTNTFVSPCSKNPSFPIKKGQKSKGVRDVQIYINRFGKLPEKIKEDCDFGSKTDGVIREAFRNAGIAYGTGVSEQTYKDVILRALNGGGNAPSTDWNLLD